MEQYRVIGKSVPRKESWDKVSGRVKYMDDKQEIGTLHVRMLTSAYAHAYLNKIDIDQTTIISTTSWKRGSPPCFRRVFI